jgi:hypothetical protein
MVEKGNKPDEYHVSRTSSSYFNSMSSFFAPNFFDAISKASYSFLPITQSAWSFGFGIFPVFFIVTR